MPTPPQRSCGASVCVDLCCRNVLPFRSFHNIHPVSKTRLSKPRRCSFRISFLEEARSQASAGASGFRQSPDGAGGGAPRLRLQSGRLRGTWKATKKRRHDGKGVKRQRWVRIATNGRPWERREVAAPIPPRHARPRGAASAVRGATRTARRSLARRDAVTTFRALTMV